MRSLRLRLLIMLLLTLSASTAASTFYSYQKAQHEIQELFDAQLAQIARIIHTSFLANPDVSEYRQLQETLEHNARLIPDYAQENGQFLSDDILSLYGHVYERKIAFQIWDHQNQLVLHSLSAPREIMVPAGQTVEGKGYHDVTLQGKAWRVFSLGGKKGRYIIMTGEEYAIRDELVREISLHWVQISSITLPLIVILVMLVIRYGFSPLQTIIKQIRQRDPQHLHAITVEQAPTEVLPLLTELNKLFERVTTTLERERRFTDDAAHELRTPLAALKTQTQVALRSQNNEERAAALHYIMRSVNRLNHLVQQLLNLSRLESGKVALALTPVNLYLFANELLSQLAPTALGKGIEIEMLNEHDPGYIVLAEESALGMLLRNIIDNAIRYTPAHGLVKLKISMENDKTVLCIEDSGPGIPAELRHRVFDRFYRITGSGESGCGLGLSIAQHCAELIHATLEFNQPENGTGLRVCMRFQSQ